jgi:hypothetical protein
MSENLSRNPANDRILVDRRSGVDRRTRSLIAALFSRGHRRRSSGGRRKADIGGYVDIYDLRTWTITIAVLLLSLMDALLTGFHVHRGSATELNPIMKAALSQGGLPVFFVLKGMMTIVPMAILMLHKEWALGRFAARLCLCSYIVVSLYHLYLVFALHPIVGHLSAVV